MKSIKRITLFLLSVFMFSSCIEDNFKDIDIKPEATGDIGKIVVVLDKPYWDSDLGKAIKETLSAPVETLPQEEPLFDVLLVDNRSFTEGLRTNHTIIIFDVNKDKKGIFLNFNNPQKDVWAKGQTVYKISGNNTSDIAEQYLRYAPSLINELENSTISLLQKEYKSNYNKAIKEELEITMNLALYVPNTMTLAENFNELIWMQQIKEKKSDGLMNEIQQGLIVYTYPFLDDSTFTLNYQIAKRDSILKKYIHGTKEGTYMTTEKTKGFEPQAVEKEYNGEYVMEVHGVWKMQNSLMGGPFVSVSRYDKKRNRIITVEGYVFAPKFKKLKYLRELEAMIYTLEY